LVKTKRVEEWQQEERLWILSLKLLDIYNIVGLKNNLLLSMNVATPLLKECEDDTHTPEMGTWESSGTPKTSEFNCKGQNTSP
jgi:hypothetical protein